MQQVVWNNDYNLVILGEYYQGCMILITLFGFVGLIVLFLLAIICFGTYWASQCYPVERWGMTLGKGITHAVSHNILFSPWILVLKTALTQNHSIWIWLR